MSTRHKRTTEEFVADARDVHGDRYDYIEVFIKKVKHKKVKHFRIVCSVHGEFTQNVYSHLHGSGCTKCVGLHRRNKEEFITDSIAKHGLRYDYSQVDYIDSKSEVTIICGKHGGFPQKPRLHLLGKGCPKCAGKYRSTEDFVADAYLVHGNKYDYSKTSYDKSDLPVSIICRVHGTFSQTPNSHLGGSGCAECAGNIKISAEEYIQRVTAVHNGLYTYSKSIYTNYNNLITITCSVHGDFERTAGYHMRGGGCPACLADKLLDYTKFVNMSNAIHSNKYNYIGESPDEKYKVLIKCKHHGVFEQSMYNHLSGNGCPSCAKHGFDPSKPSVFYVYSFGSYAGFGITNDFEKRSSTHSCTFEKKCIDAKLVSTHNMSGESAQSLERYLKQTLPIVNSGIEGFKTEAVSIENLQNLLDVIKLKEVEINV